MVFTPSSWCLFICRFKSCIVTWSLLTSLNMLNGRTVLWNCEGDAGHVTFYTSPPPPPPLHARWTACGVWSNRKRARAPVNFLVLSGKLRDAVGGCTRSGGWRLRWRLVLESFSCGKPRSILFVYSSSSYQMELSRQQESLTEKIKICQRPSFNLICELINCRIRLP